MYNRNVSCRRIISVRKNKIKFIYLFILYRSLATRHLYIHLMHSIYQAYIMLIIRHYEVAETFLNNIYFQNKTRNVRSVMSEYRFGFIVVKTVSRQAKDLSLCPDLATPVLIFSSRYSPLFSLLLISLIFRCEINVQIFSHTLKYLNVKSLYYLMFLVNE